MLITLSGSYAFNDKMKEIADQLKELGHDVHLPTDCEHMKPEDHDHEGFANRKQGLMKDHFQKIKESDALLVCNFEKKLVPGYVGSCTLIEMGVASHEEMPVYILHKIHRSLPHYAEIAGLKPIFLNGKLHEIE